MQAVCKEGTLKHCYAAQLEIGACLGQNLVSQCFRSSAKKMLGMNGQCLWIAASNSHDLAHPLVQIDSSLFVTDDGIRW